MVFWLTVGCAGINNNSKLPFVPKGCQKAPTLKKKLKIFQLYSSAKIWPYLGLVAKNDKNGNLFSQSLKVLKNKVPQPH